MSLVAATIADAPRFARVHAAAFLDAPARAWSEREFETLLATPGAFGFLAPKTVPAAIALAWIVGDDAELLTLAVDPEKRRRGYGRKLVEAVAEAARAGGARRVLLEVAADNSAARALYETANFHRIGVRPRYYGGVDAYALARVLGASPGQGNERGA